MLKRLGRRGKKLLANMPKAVISNSLNIARTFKIVVLVLRLDSLAISYSVSSNIFSVSFYYWTFTFVI